MTITTNPARNELTATAAQTVFNFTFKIFAVTDLNVYITPTGQDANDSTDLTTAYVVDPGALGNEDGGFLTMNVGVTAGFLVTIVSNVPESRTTDYQFNGDFIPDTVNDDFDRVVQLSKQTEDQANRTLGFQQSEQGVSDISLAKPVADLFLRYNNTADKVITSGAPAVLIPNITQANVASMSSSSTLVIGDVVQTLGYTTNGDSGANLYEIVAGGTGVDDGGSFIDLSGTGLQAKGLFTDELHINMFGAVSDTTDGTDGTDSLAAAQACFDYVESLGISGVRKSVDVTGKYRLSNTLKFPSNIEIHGSGKMGGLYQVSVDAPVIASKAWFSAEATSPTGFVLLRDFHVWGNATAADAGKTGQHGIVLHDFYSNIENIRDRFCGGDGLRLDAKNDVGTLIAGTLVENIIDEYDTYFAEGIGIHIGNTTTATLTDGKISNCNVLVGTTGNGGLLMTSAAGWDISNIHTYNTAIASPINIQNAFYTNISNLYIERFLTSGLTVLGQKAINIDNVNIRSASTGAPSANDKAITLARSSSVTDVEFNLSNVSIEMEAAVAIYGIEALSGSTTVNLSNFTVFGANSSLALGNNLSTSFTAVKYAGLFEADTLDISTRGFNGVIQGQCATSGLIGGGGAIAVNLNIGKINSFRKSLGTLSIMAKSNHNGGNTASYVAQVMVSAKDNAVNPWTLNVLVTSAAVGFSVAPAITVTNDTAGIGTLDVAFTFSNATSQGAVGYIFTPAN